MQAQQPESRLCLFEKKARAVKAVRTDLCRCQRRYKIEKRGLEGQSSSVTKNMTQVEIALAGEYQFLNGALALEVLDELKRKGYEISEEAVRKPV